MNDVYASIIALPVEKFNLFETRGEGLAEAEYDLAQDKCELVVMPGMMYG